MGMRLPERRREQRVEVSRPAKVQCADTGRFLPAWVRNLSAGGALLELRTRTPLMGGQPIRVGIALGAHQAMLRNADLADARVVRSLSRDDVHQVAVQFAATPTLVAA